MEDHEDNHGIAARDRLTFLLRASELLSESLDYEETLRQVADLAVPRIADWCSIDLVETDGGIHQVAVAHVDPEKRRLAQELRERFPPDPNATTGTANVIRTGRTELIERIDEGLIESALSPGQDELGDIVRELGLSSAMTVPLIARDRVLGAVTFVSAESGHQYGREDVRFAEDLARRAATAIDNARRYGQQTRATVRSEERFHLHGRKRPRLRDLHARRQRQRDHAGTRAPGGSRATRPTRSSASTSRASTPRTRSSSATRSASSRSRAPRGATRRRDGACARTARASGPTSSSPRCTTTAAS